MNILMISSYLPYPLLSGGQIRLYNLIRHLSATHKITLICERRQNQTQEDIDAVKKYCKKVVIVDRKKQWSISNIIRTGISSDPFLLTGHTLPEMKDKITDALHNDTFDVIHVETFYVLQNLPATKLPVVLVEHNVEYLVYKRFAHKATLLIRPLLMLDVNKLEKKEKAAWRNVTQVVAVSDVEKDIIGNAIVVPNGVDIEKFQFRKKEMKKAKKILFIGDFKWIQNRDALSLIIDKIWPILLVKAKQQNLSVKLWIVGRSLSEKFSAIINDTIIFDTKNTQPTEDIFSEADILLSPIHVGGGTSYKILEALSVGTPVITTPLGIEGLKVKNNRDILIATEPSDFADKVIDLLTDAKQYREIAKNGRMAVEKEYTWEHIAKKLEEVYQGVLKKS